MLINRALFKRLLASSVQKIVQTRSFVLIKNIFNKREREDKKSEFERFSRASPQALRKGQTAINDTRWN